MPVNLITLPEWEVREWKAGHGLLFSLIMDPLTAVAVTAALAEFTAARCARRPPAEFKEKTPTSSLDETESEKIPTNPPVTKKLSDAAWKRQAYERRMEQRRRKEETEPKSKPARKRLSGSRRRANHRSREKIHQALTSLWYCTTMMTCSPLPTCWGNPKIIIQEVHNAQMSRRQYP